MNGCVLIEKQVGFGLSVSDLEVVERSNVPMRRWLTYKIYKGTFLRGQMGFNRKGSRAKAYG